MPWQVHTLTGHGERVVSVEFSPDGKRVVSGSWDKSVKVWDAATGAEVSSFVRLRSVWRGFGILGGCSPQVLSEKKSQMRLGGWCAC